ncbi:MAG TPA: ABC transporter permease, partial [Myxococcales bacterium]|nr:ABC transporter permease [Myxococcales bacterium]
MNVQAGLRLCRRAFVNLWRAPLPSLVSVVTIALALFLGCAFAAGIFGARALLRSWGAEASLTLYLDPAQSEDQALALAARVRAENPGLDAVYVGRAEALSRLRVELGDLGAALDGLPQNPLPPTLELRPRAPLSASAVRALAGRLRELPGVSDVDYGREWLEKLEALGRALRAAGGLALTLVVGAALLVVANTIRLAVYARRDEIEIMKLVGATDGHVRLPFLLEGALQGLLGAVLALGGLACLERWILPRAAAAFAFASGVAAPHLRPETGALLLACGALVGFLGS